MMRRRGLLAGMSLLVAAPGLILPGRPARAGLWRRPTMSAEDYRTLPWPRGEEWPVLDHDIELVFPPGATSGRIAIYPAFREALADALVKSGSGSPWYEGRDGAIHVPLKSWAAEDIILPEHVPSAGIAWPKS
jgi:hypothetical protein